MAIYDHLQLGKKWNLPRKQFNAVLVPKSDNCGDSNHLSPKCPKPHDEEKCKRLVSCEPSHGALREVEVEEAVEVLVDMGMDQVAGQILKGNELLGTVLKLLEPTQVSPHHPYWLMLGKIYPLLLQAALYYARVWQMLHKRLVMSLLVH